MEECTTGNCEEPPNKKDYFVSAPPPKSANRKRLVVFGTFDIIHPSHLKFLLEARRITNCPGCELIVVVARDSSIQKIKGRKPIFDEKDRLRLLSGLRLVDYARLGNEGENHLKILVELKPDYIVLGYDQLNNERPLLDFIKQHNIDAKICRLPRFESGDLSSSSEVRERVINMINKKKEADIKDDH